MNNPARILLPVDAKLRQPVELIVFGRAALVLGFANLPADALATRDVDAILPRDFLTAPDAREQWWSALYAANAELEVEGLYLTHLFEEDQIILRTGWRGQVVDIAQPELRYLRLLRPATVDLILTEMMRGPDPDDMCDVRFYLEREPTIGVAELERAFEEAAGPDIPEVWDLFSSVKPRVLAMAQPLGSHDA